MARDSGTSPKAKTRASRSARSFARPCHGLSFLRPCGHAPRPTACRRGRGRDAHGGDSAAGRCERQRGRAAVRTEGPRPIPGRGRRHPRSVHQAGRPPLPAPSWPPGRRHCRPADASRARAAGPPGSGPSRDAPGNARLGRGRPPVPALAPRPFARRRRRRLRSRHPQWPALLPASRRSRRGRPGRPGDARGAAPAALRVTGPCSGARRAGQLLPPRAGSDRRSLRRPRAAAGAAIRASTSRPTTARASRRPAWEPPSSPGGTSAATATSW